MTEDDAKTKICPVMTSFVPGANGGAVRAKVQCQGSACAWWRWVSLKDTDEYQRRCNKRAAELSKKTPGDHQKIRSEVLAEMMAEAVDHGECAAAPL